MKIKTACLLLSLLHLGSASALGLGEINVRSYLGQPLHVTVALVGTTPNTAADCFSLESSSAGIAPLVRPQLSIERSGGQALLHIRTSQAIHDPVAQFVLVSDCEARLKRDYVILLDPPAQIESVTVSNNESIVQTMETASVTTAPKPRSIRHSRRSTQRTRAITPRLATSTTPSVTPRASAQPAATPRLVLSGRHGNAANVALALRLDTNLPDLTLPRPERLTTTEMSDENTALTRKLAHLETQLASLQQRNLELEAQRAATAPPKVSPPAAGRPAQWPLVLLTVGLVAGGGLLAAWLRRRSRNSRPTVLMDDTAWTPPDTMPALLKAERTAAPQAKPQQPPEMSLLEAESTEVKDDILDQAEVYMAHGHGELAIHLLQEHLRDAPNESPIPWLLLLDLLQREGDTSGYAAASAECRRYFNINLSGQPVPPGSENGQGLEAYPLLLEELVRVWKSPDASAFFDELIYDNRGGTRIGFEPGVYRDILMLRAIADQDKDLHAA